MTRRNAGKSLLAGLAATPGLNAATRQPLGFQLYTIRRLIPDHARDALQRLAAAGFPVADYQYTGFGAIYFVDFILFHKILGLKRLVSLEQQESLTSRMKFNRPFSCVEIKMVPASSEIPNLSRDASRSTGSSGAGNGTPPSTPSIPESFGV